MSIRIVSVLAILAAVCLAVLVGLQIVERQHYRAPPSVWPAANS